MAGQRYYEVCQHLSFYLPNSSGHLSMIVAI
jgi:hypothetical protein